MDESSNTRRDVEQSSMTRRRTAIVHADEENIIILDETKQNETKQTLEIPTTAREHTKTKTVNFGTPEIYEISPNTPNLLYAIDNNVDNHHKVYYSNSLSNIEIPSPNSSTSSDETHILVEDDYNISLDLSKIIRTHEKQIEEHSMKKTGSSYSIRKTNSKDSAKTPTETLVDVVKKLVSPTKGSFRKSDVVSYSEIYLDQFQDWKNEKHETGAIISWRNICYQVKRETSFLNDIISKSLKKEGDSKMEKPSKFIQILNGIDGIAYPGSILAIMVSWK